MAMRTLEIIIKLLLIQQIAAFIPSTASFKRLTSRDTSTSLLRPLSPLRGAIIEIGDTEDENRLENNHKNLKEEIMSILKEVVDPESLDDIVTAGYVTDVLLAKSSGGNTMDIQITLAPEDPSCSSSMSQEIKNLCLLQLSTLEWAGGIKVALRGEGEGEGEGGIDPPSQLLPDELDIKEKNIPAGMKGVKRSIAVSSCKGGVGKSTTSVNLAYSLASRGYKVGILDADIYGPSIPTMTSPLSKELISDPVTGMLQPLVCAEGVKMMSMGWVNKGAAIMRGPMVNQVLNQFVGLCDWGELDYLVIDMPPGTGDIQLTLAQTTEVDAAVIVTTPQRLSFVDVVKGIDLFDTVNIPCVAIVENMAELQSYEFTPSFYEELAVKIRGSAGKEIREIVSVLKASIEGQNQKRRFFGNGYVGRMVNMWGIENIVSMPLLADLSVASDTGMPYVLSYPESAVASAMMMLVGHIETELEQMESVQHQVNFDTVKNEIKYQGVVAERVSKSKQKQEGAAGLHDVDITVKPFDLRADCRCALCVEEMTGKSLLDIFSLPPDVKPISMAPIGRYALSVDWSDGHKSLFPFRQIATLGDKYAEANK